MFWTGVGVLFIVAAWSQQVSNWTTALLAAIGALWIYCALQSFFPRWHFRRAYAKSGLTSKKYQAELNDQGLNVTGSLESWHISWPGLSVKGEDKQVFLLYGANTLFIFGKKYLTPEQQQELRHLAEIPAIPAP